jgi:dihydrofolate synthase/folylpolyglutamate synthase
MNVSEIQAAIGRLLALGGELAPPAPGQPRRKFDLAHMRTLLAALGHPEQQFRSVLIAGTNGKGSTAATLASILQAGGYRTGLYTSPHLEQPNERVRIHGIAITDESLAVRFTQVETAATQLVAAGELPHPPSFFETITAIAFLHFAGAEAEPPVDIAVLEVGLGGRLDATNVVEPLISVITDISLDHTAWLGDTLSAIAREKAGILRPQGILVTLPQHPEVNQALGEVAIGLEVEGINAAEYLPMRTTGHDSMENRYPLPIAGLGPEQVVLSVDSPLAGSHQQRNLALAIAAALTLHRRFGFPLTARAIEEGIRRTHWSGRLQLLLPPEGTVAAPVLLDAAHNPAGAWALRAALSTLPMPGPRTLVFACMADKALDELAQVLFPVFDQVWLTAVPGPRAATVESLAKAAERTGAATHREQNPLVALQAAQSATPGDGLVVIAGSIALLGAVAAPLRHWTPRRAENSKQMSF